MVKRQKEKQYQSAQEHRQYSQIRSGSANASGNSQVQKRLPFDCCALTLRPFVRPVCTNNGIIFENEALLPFLLKHKKDPVTGNSLSSKDIITLNMDKDEEGRWQCPVLTKPFSDHTKIVAVKQNPPGTEANVYSYEAFEELNLKAKNYEDLISGLKFHKHLDVIVLNDPLNEEYNRVRDISNFHHLLQSRKDNNSGYNTHTASKSTNVKHSLTAQRIMDQIHREKQKRKHTETPTAAATGDGSENEPSKKLKIFTHDLEGGVSMTTGKTSGSFTSTIMDVSHTTDAREATDDEILENLCLALRNLKKKGYATLKTNMGDIGLELHCDICPKTCMNFLGLAEQKKYNGSVFHRLIPNFMIQGGKPGKERKGEKDTSLWGEPFADEFDDRLVHSGAGILSMANAGANTNKRQFFLTLKSCRHLDRKHTIFGRVVQQEQGINILENMEDISTDKKDRPLQEVKILSVDVLVNPIQEAQEVERERMTKQAIKRQKERDTRKLSALGKSKRSTALEAQKRQDEVKNQSSSSNSRSTIGKYLPTNIVPTNVVGSLTAVAAEKKKMESSNSGVTSTESGKLDMNMNLPSSRLPAPPKKTTFGDFSGW